MAEIRITDEASLKACLDKRPPKDAQIIAFRAAARVFPLWGRAVGYDHVHIAPRPKEVVLTGLSVMRPILTLSAARIYPSSEITLKASDASTVAFMIAQVTNQAYAANAAYAAGACADAADRLTYVEDAADTVAYAAHAVTDVSVDAAVIWKAIEKDVNFLQAGGVLDSIRLWHGLAPDWFTKADTETRVIWDKDPAPWVFWRRWWDGVISGDMPFAPETLRDIALIDDAIWQQGPHAVAAEIDKILPLPPPPPPEKHTPLALTYIYDFTRHGETLRLSGVPLDFEGRSEDDIAKCLKKLHDWKDDLGDWIDFAGDALRQQNDPSTLLKAAQKLAEFIDKSCNSKDFAAGRLLTMGGNLRLLAMDEMQRGLVGPTLATMMDARVDQLSAIIGQCFGHVLARLEPLNDLTLGTHDPARLMADIEAYLDHLKTIDPKEVLPLDQEAKAAIADMLRELQEMDAAIAAGVGPKQVAVMQSRFAYRYGALASTLGRALEKGREPFGKTVSRFDEGVKWYKRWETLNNIVDWFSNLPPPPV